MRRAALAIMFGWFFFHTWRPWGYDGLMTFRGCTTIAETADGHPLAVSYNICSELVTIKTSRMPPLMTELHGPFAALLDCQVAFGRGTPGTYEHVSSGCYFLRHDALRRPN